MHALAAPPEVAPLVRADLHRREPHPGLQILLGLCGFLAAAGVGTGLVARVVTTAVHGTPGTDASADPSAWYAAHPWPGVAGGLVVEAALVLALYPALVHRLARRPVYELSRHGAWRELGVGAALGAAYMVLVVLVVWALGGYHVVSVGWDTGILTGLAVGVGPGIAEEVAFRGILLRVLDKPLGSVGALALTAALFGALHLSNPEATWWGAVAIAVEAGGLLGACYLLTRRLWLAIGLHASWNFVEGGIFGIDVSGSGSGRGLVASTMSGPTWLSGGAMGVEGSAVAVVLGLALGLSMLARAGRRGYVLPPRQRSSATVDLNQGSDATAAL
jgi:hypothetical protein